MKKRELFRVNFLVQDLEPVEVEAESYYEAVVLASRRLDLDRQYTIQSLNEGAEVKKVNPGQVGRKRRALV